MFIFNSAKRRVSKSSNCECVIRSQILKSAENLSCNTSTTWLNESIRSHVTTIVLGTDSCGEQVHGEISRRTEQCKLALAVKPNNVYNTVAILTELNLRDFLVTLFAVSILQLYDFLEF